MRGVAAGVPELNARLEGDEIVYLDRYDLGVAVQTEQGLVVPVVRDCDSRSVEELRAEVERLAEGARAGTLKPEELRGSTFTVSERGQARRPLPDADRQPSRGRDSQHRPDRRCGRSIARRRSRRARQIGYVSLTFDHRVVDGARAAEFGLAVIRRLEQG